VVRKERPDPASLADRIEQIIVRSTDDTHTRKRVLERFELTDPELDRILEELVGKYEPYTPLWELLPRLRPAYKLAVINNGTGLTKPLFHRKLRIFEVFDPFLISAVEGIRKPDPRIYLRACERLAVPPERCLFLDDKIENVEGARRVGMEAVHWNDPPACFAAFTRRLGLEE
jgi:HAD superfamily hydrolase (TIGR01509 family)